MLKDWGQGHEMGKPTVDRSVPDAASERNSEAHRSVSVGSCHGLKREATYTRDTLASTFSLLHPRFSFTGMVTTITSEPKGQLDGSLTAQRPRGKGCLSCVPYIVGFICVLVQSAS